MADSANTSANADQQAHYRTKQQAGRKDLWREALESSSKGDDFLISLLEVVLEDEQASDKVEEKQRSLKRLVNMEDTTVPYRASGYSDWCRSFCSEPLYKLCSVLAILAAGVVGAIEVDNDTVPMVVQLADSALIAWFCAECIVHIAAEGEHPQCYFFGRDSVSWSLPARWNVFDFSVSYLSLILATIITETGEASYRVVVLLRLLRLARLTTILNKSPEMTVIVAGFVSAVNSVVYILLVLLVAFYIYAVLGVDLFSGNDPVRFGSLPMAMLTLLQAATLSGWDEALYTAQFGCAKHPGELYSQSHRFTDQNSQTGGLSDYVETPSGRFPALVCDAPHAQPLAGALFFTTFTAIANFIVLSLFVGIITLSMLEQMETHIRSKRMDAKAKEFRNQLEVSVAHAIESREFLLQQLKHSSLGMQALPVAHLEGKKASATSAAKAKEQAALKAKGRCNSLGNKKGGRGEGSKFQTQAAIDEEAGGLQGGEEYEDSDKEETFVDIQFEVDFTFDKWATEAEAKKPLLLIDPDEFDEETGRVRPGRRRMVVPAAKKLTDEELIREAMDLLRTDESFELVSENRTTELLCCVDLLGSYRGRYELLAKRCKAIITNARFETLITMVVVCTAVLVVLDLWVDRRNHREVNEATLYQLNLAVLSVFTIEALLKVCSEDVAPLTYFNNSWNCFDFAVVVLSFAGLFLGGGKLAILRVVRLLQLVKLTKRLKQLRVLIDALLTGFASTGYVLALILVFNFVLGVAAVQYFKHSDQFHYGSLTVAMGTLFRIETLQSWEQALYVGLWGCGTYTEPGLSQDLEPCNQNEPLGYPVVAFYAVVVVFGALVMPSLLVAVITAAVREANFQVMEENELDQRVASVCGQYAAVLNKKDISVYDVLFKFGDRDGSGDLSLDEIMTVLAHFDTAFGGSSFTRALASQVFMCVDRDLGGTIDKAEFFEMVGKISLVNDVLTAKGLVFPDAEKESNSASSNESASGSSSAGAASNEGRAIAPSTRHCTGAPHWPALLELAEKAVALDAAAWAAWDAWDLARKKAAEAMAARQEKAELGPMAPPSPRDRAFSSKGQLFVKQAHASFDSAAGGSGDLGASGPLVDRALGRGYEARQSASAAQAAAHSAPPQGVLKRECTALELMHTLGPALFRLCVSGCLDTVMPPTMEPFEPSASFLGQVPNHVFATGKFGTGYYFDQAQAWAQPPGTQQRLALEAQVFARCRRVRAQSVWDLMASRWALLPESAHGLGDGVRCPSGAQPARAYDAIHASLLASSLQALTSPLLPLGPSFPSRRSSTRPRVASSFSSYSSSSSSSSSGGGGEDVATPSPGAGPYGRPGGAVTPLGLLGRLHEKLRVEMARSQSLSRATPRALDAFDVLHARARRCSAAHLQETCPSPVGRTVRDGADALLLSEHAERPPAEWREDTHAAFSDKPFPCDLHTSLFRSGGPGLLALPSGLAHPPGSRGLLQLDHLAAPHTALTPSAPFPAPLVSPPERPAAVGHFSALEVSSSFYSMDHPVDCALSLLGAPGWAALQPGGLLVGPPWGTRGFAWEQPVDGAAASGGGYHPPDAGLQAVRRRQVREFHGHVRWNRTRDVAAALHARPYLVAERDPRTGNTALHVAAQNDWPELVAVFLRRFGDLPPPSASHLPPAWCNVNAQNHKGNTALHMAVEYALLECKGLLLSGGARHDIVNADGHPAIRGVSGALGQNDLAFQVQERKVQKLKYLSDALSTSPAGEPAEPTAAGAGVAL